MTITRIAIIAFAGAVALGPFHTAPGYSSASNVISELGAQGAPGSFVMSAAFVVLGLSVAIDGLRVWRGSVAPFVAFGLCFAAAGIFGHKPITPGVPYSVWMDRSHSILATLSGVALTVGFVWQARLAKTRPYRTVVAGLAVACVGLPLLMLAVPGYQGIVQRVMYSAVFAWFWACYPCLVMPNLSLQRQA